MEEFTKTPSQSSSAPVSAKVPPNATKLEEAVLGALLLERGAILSVYNLLSVQDFYVNANRLVYQAIRDLYDTMQPIDMLTCMEQLRKNGHLQSIGGPSYLAELSNKVASAANIQHHALLILDKSFHRSAIDMGTRLVNYGYDETIHPEDLRDLAEKMLTKMVLQLPGRDIKTLDEALKQRFEDYDKLLESGDKGAMLGIPTKIKAIDDFIAGLQPEDLGVVAAEPGMGKTSMILTIAKNVCVDQNIPFAVFSMEMSSGQLVDRMLSNCSGVDSRKVRNSRLWDESDRFRIENAKAEMSGKPFYIDDNGNKSLEDIKSKVRELVANKGVKVVLVDYLQIMDWGKKDERLGITDITKGLKALAKELQITIILLSQLSRPSSIPKGTRPTLKRLKGSGSIEADADWVMFIHRPEYYGIIENEHGESVRGIAELIWGKNRHGKLGTGFCRFFQAQTKFDNLADDLDFFEDPGKSVEEITF